MDPPALLLLALLPLCIALAMGWWWSSRRWSRAARQRAVQASWGEDAAEELLAAHGFQVVERQARAWGRMLVDGRELDYEVRADLLVEALAGSGWPVGALLVAEVKTGLQAPDPGHPATRRQLLEYDRVFQPDGLLLVDMQGGEVISIAFPDEAGAASG